MVVLSVVGRRTFGAAGALGASGALAAGGRGRAALLLLVTVAVAFGLGYATQFVVNRPVFNAEWSPVPQQEARSFPSLNALTSTALFGSLALLVTRPLSRGKGRLWLLIAWLLPPF